MDIRTGGSHTVAGGAIGALAGFIVGIVVSKPSEKDLRSSDGFATLNQPIGAVLGTALGAVIGLTVTGPHWLRVALPPGAGRACVTATNWSGVAREIAG